MWISKTWKYVIGLCRGINVGDTVGFRIGKKSYLVKRRKDT